MNTCQECGMVVKDMSEYHPYAACLMFKACHDGEVVRANLAAVQAARATPADHSDDRAVDEFARLMKQKMAASRAKGRRGWDDPNVCSVETLSAMLHEHVAKGDPVDVANFCMMLRHYDAKITSADQSKLQVWYGSMPESNGKTNWTAILHRGDFSEGITLDRSEHPDRVRYEADRVRYLIGEIDKQPCVLDYDADKHSGYVAPAEHRDPVGTPEGWKLVPTEPTETMVVDGFESWPAQFFSSPEEWEAFEAMSGCQKAAHKARLCYRAMLASAPQAPQSDARSVRDADPIRVLIAAHTDLLEQNPYAYFELAYTRYTGWMAWLCSNSQDDDPNRKILAKGQGESPEAACTDALKSAPPQKPVSDEVKP